MRGMKGGRSVDCVGEGRRVPEEGLRGQGRERRNQGASIDPAPGRLTHLPKDTRDLVSVEDSARARV